MAWIYRADQRSAPTKAERRSDRPQETVEGGVGPVAGVSAAWMPRPSPQGRVHGVPRDRTHPAIPSRFAIDVDVDVDVASAGAGRSPAETRTFAA
ncbi:hypothetical protein H2198_008954 [Neophaeococcomyces mojaviensis]|uniref:Uncharacterized protein n=1 Tax=Neophaeococcomyces mojaviensis TaxID=3383035 RepID=A0ACC2ZW48_9EURO|nr:hypothetical protein H2198_008954 [Knufia sp. JES_112]